MSPAAQLAAARPARRAAADDAAPPPTRSAPRRTLLLSLASAWPAAAPLLAPGDLGSALQGELSLWGQELDFYRRRLPGPLGAGRAKAPPRPAAPARRLDAGLAAFLLDAPLAVLAGGAGSSSQGGSGDRSGGAGAEAGADVRPLPRWSRAAYDAAYSRLLRQELPYARDAGICGHCGGTATEPSDDITDPGWWGFRAYCSWKAVAEQLPPGPRSAGGPGGGEGGEGGGGMDMLHGGADPAAWAGVGGSGASSGGGGGGSSAEAEGAAAVEALPPPPAAAALQRLRAGVGAALVARAAAGPAGPALASDAATLDNIRGGVRAMLRYFESQGGRPLASGAGMGQAGGVRKGVRARAAEGAAQRPSARRPACRAPPRRPVGGSRDRAGGPLARRVRGALTQHSPPRPRPAPAPPRTALDCLGHVSGGARRRVLRVWGYRLFRRQQARAAGGSQRATPHPRQPCRRTLPNRTLNPSSPFARPDRPPAPPEPAGVGRGGARLPQALAQGARHRRPRRRAGGGGGLRPLLRRRRGRGLPAALRRRDRGLQACVSAGRGAAARGGAGGRRLPAGMLPAMPTPKAGRAASPNASPLVLHPTPQATPPIRPRTLSPCSGRCAASSR
jgi:hypothetical protein